MPSAGMQQCIKARKSPLRLELALTFQITVPTESELQSSHKLVRPCRRLEGAHTNRCGYENVGRDYKTVHLHTSSAKSKLTLRQ